MDTDTSSKLITISEILKYIKSYFTRTKKIIDPVLTRAIQAININGYEYIKRTVDEIERELSNITIVEIARDGIESLNFDLFDQLFNLTSKTNRVLKLIAGSETQEKAKQTMSQTYFSELSGSIDMANEAKRKIYAEVDNLISLVVNNYTPVIEDSKNIDDIYNRFVKSKERSYFSYRLLVGILIKLSDNNINIDKLTEYIKDNVFGITETPEKIINDMTSRAQYIDEKTSRSIPIHPIQSMGLMYSLINAKKIEKKEQVNIRTDDKDKNKNERHNFIKGGEGIPKDSELNEGRMKLVRSLSDDVIIIDKTLQGKVVEYDLETMLSPSSETTSYGINHKIITRLNTIKEVDKSLDDSIPSIKVPDFPKKIIQTIDGGLTYSELDLKSGTNNISGTNTCELYKNIGAGPRLRLDKINDCYNNIAISQIGNQEVLTKLLTEYEKATDSFKFAFNTRLSKHIIEEREMEKQLPASQQKEPKTKSKLVIDKLVVNALFKTFTNYWKEFVEHKVIYLAVEDEMNSWILSNMVTLIPKISRLIKKISSEKLEKELEEVNDTIPMVPFKIFIRMLRSDL